MNNARIIERAFNLIPVVTVIACAIFSARLVNDFVEARYIGEAEASVAAPVRQDVAVAPPRSKAGAALSARNMFCSDCELSSLEGPIAVASAGSGVPDTQLPLRLITTNVSTDPQGSFASLANTETGHEGAFWMGNSIPGAGAIEKIAGRYVDFHNPATNRLERLRLDRPAPPATPRAAATTRAGRATGSRMSALDKELEEKVRQVNPTTWEVDRSVLQTLIGSPAAMRSTRVSPAIKNGKIAGFKVTRLPSTSPAAKIGIRRGDIIAAANGTQLTSPDVVLGLMTQVQTLSRMVITIERGGKNVEHTYLLR